MRALVVDDDDARRELLEEAWEAYWYGPTRTIDVHVASVRKKLGDPTMLLDVRLRRLNAIWVPGTVIERHQRR